MNRFSGLVLLLFLSACTATSVDQPRYFVLSAEPAAHEESSSPATGSGPRLLLQNVQLADYLQSANLILQVSEHEFHFSPTHLWAEPLAVGIGRALSSAEPGISLAAPGKISSNYDALLKLHVDYFHIVDGEAVILAGSFTLEDPTQLKTSLTRRFDLRKPLLDSGYPYAVNAMSTLIRELARSIASAATATPDVDFVKPQELRLR